MIYDLCAAIFSCKQQVHTMVDKITSQVYTSFTYHSHCLCSVCIVQEDFMFTEGEQSVDMIYLKKI